MERVKALLIKSEEMYPLIELYLGCSQTQREFYYERGMNPGVFIPQSTYVFNFSGIAPAFGGVRAPA
jgi:hypothetical protein